jgi:hypothetical protein
MRPSTTNNHWLPNSHDRSPLKRAQTRWTNERGPVNVTVHEASDAKRLAMQGGSSSLQVTPVDYSLDKKAGLLVRADGLKLGVGEGAVEGAVLAAAETQLRCSSG